jgi:Tfp pilus assembly protein PilF
MSTSKAGTPRLAEARTNAEEALRLDPASAEAHSSVARCAQNANDAATTNRELETSVRLLPNDASFVLTAAVTQWGMGWNDEAVANFKRATELGPREAQTFYSCGVLLKELDHALLLAPESVYFPAPAGRCRNFLDGRYQTRASNSRRPASRPGSGWKSNERLLHARHLRTQFFRSAAAPAGLPG